MLLLRLSRTLHLRPVLRKYVLSKTQCAPIHKYPTLPPEYLPVISAAIPGFPPFDRIDGDGIRTISEKDLKEGGKKRFIIVGDIHGMHGSFK